MCDDWVVFVLGRIGGGFALTATTDGAGSCRLGGFVRAWIVDLAQPVDPATIVVVVDFRPCVVEVGGATYDPRMVGRIASIVVAGLVVLGALMPWRGLQVVLRGDAGTPPLTVTLEDGTGLVTFVGPGPTNEVVIGAAAVAGHPNAVLIGWLGGHCDEAVRIGLERDNDRIQVYRSTSASSEDCLLEGIARSIVIELRQPIDPAKVIDTSDWLYAAG